MGGVEMNWKLIVAIAIAYIFIWISILVYVMDEDATKGEIMGLGLVLLFWPVVMPFVFACAIAREIKKSIHKKQ